MFVASRRRAHERALSLFMLVFVISIAWSACGNTGPLAPPDDEDVTEDIAEDVVADTEEDVVPDDLSEEVLDDTLEETGELDTQEETSDIDDEPDVDPSEPICDDLEAEVAASPEVEELVGITDYHVTFNRESLRFVIELWEGESPEGVLELDLAGESLGINARFDWTFSASDGEVLTMSEILYEELEIEGWHRVVRTISFEDRVLVMEQERFHDGSTRAAFMVPADAVVGTPSVGYGVQRHDGEWWGIRGTSSTDADTIEDWFGEIGLEDWMDDPVMETFWTVYQDDAWRAGIMRARVRCGIAEGVLDAEDFPDLDTMKLTLTTCNEAALGCATSLGCPIAVSTVVGSGLCYVSVILCIRGGLRCLCEDGAGANRCANECDAASCNVQCGPCGGRCEAPEGTRLFGGGCVCNTGACCELDCSCRGGCSGGDPHILTLDGAYYDVHAVGEFVLLRSDDGKVEVQTRHAPTAECSNVAFNSAVATRLGDTRVMFVASGGPAIQLSDDRTFELEPMRERLDGGTLMVEQHGGPVLIDYDTGDRLVVHFVFAPSFGITWLNARVQPSLTRAGALEGLLGDYDGDPTNDVRMADGDVLDGEQISETETREHADSWRVTNETSLFIYDDGEDTETFTDLLFPEFPFHPDQLDADRREMAEEACEGIEIETLYFGCIADVACGGADRETVQEFFETVGEPAHVIETVADDDGEPEPTEPDPGEPV